MNTWIVNTCKFEKMFVHTKSHTHTHKYTHTYSPKGQRSRSQGLTQYESKICHGGMGDLDAAEGHISHSHRPSEPCIFVFNEVYGV